MVDSPNPEEQMGALLVYKNNVKKITFDEDNFAVNKARVIKLCNAIIAKKYPKVKFMN